MQPDPPAPALNWQTANQVDLAEAEEQPDGGQSNARPNRRSEFVLDRLEQAREGRKPVILYVSTARDDRAYAQARANCERLESTIFQNYRIATAMQEFELIRVNIEDLDNATVRRYGITARVAPQLLMYDFQLRRLFAMQGEVNGVTFLQRMEQLKEHCEQLAQRLDRQSNR